MKSRLLPEVVHAAITVALFLIPLLIHQFPEFANLTIGGVLTLAYNFLARKA